MASTPTDRHRHPLRAISITAPTIVAVATMLPGCGLYSPMAPSPDPGPEVWAGVLTGRDNLDRYDVYLDQRPDGTALLTIAPGSNPLPQDAGPYPTATVYRGRWFIDQDEHGRKRWVLDVQDWPPMTLRRNFYWTRYETHAKFVDPPTPPGPCNDWGTVFALVTDDPARR